MYSDRSPQQPHGDATTNPKCENSRLYIQQDLSQRIMFVVGVNFPKKILVCNHQVMMFLIVLIRGKKMFSVATQQGVDDAGIKSKTTRLRSQTFILGLDTLFRIIIRISIHYIHNNNKLKNVYSPSFKHSKKKTQVHSINV